MLVSAAAVGAVGTPVNAGDAVGAFVPTMVPYIHEGFRVLNDMPDFYKGFLGAAIAASFGIKALTKWG